MRKVSVVIPVYNDKAPLQKLLEHLGNALDRQLMELVVVDGGSTDGVDAIIPAPVKLLRTDRACRAVQLNAGAEVGTGEILYFLHADCLPPLTFVKDINRAMDAGYMVGCFRLKLMPGNLLLNINSFLSRFRTMFSGGGDQSLYLPKSVFEEIGGYNETFCVMEDFELVHRLMPLYGYHILPKDIQASARKYSENSYFRVNKANYLAFQLYKKKVPPQVIREQYNSLLRRN
ncbi:TIGR04283 family arsenosugar biosynthesis glycosyltransferase [Pontibacter sp. JH31]|uniref:TIGR04283 family arsenosugar biosynthesis glycosyltransferase n=1 Tax=Pontibacter aquaedesilientis TaxID=2766980 RepID=A0ABR7XEX4_9BACT|nr:TIGR04283 family arsenosugar biosynthesis glycosyltransferase [Pontibacter aquaedesilientis]MBD1396845.1 TIGR04283 family arsenosugar biosynthesis glycosyltransferase [Pontibacter aquaedesilientis]